MNDQALIELLEEGIAELKNRMNEQPSSEIVEFMKHVRDISCLCANDNIFFGEDRIRARVARFASLPEEIQLRKQLDVELDIIARGEWFFDPETPEGKDFIARGWKPYRDDTGEIT
jgi:hypothetical protein